MQPCHEIKSNDAKSSRKDVAVDPDPQPPVLILQTFQLLRVADLSGKRYNSTGADEISWENILETAMTQDRFERIEDLFHAALERAPDTRAAFLNHACEGDSDLWREVVSLLAQRSHDGSQSASGSNPLDRPVISVAAELLCDPAVTQLVIGTHLGPYEIEALVGAGGMGQVWKARDTRLNRLVAIKKLKAEHTDRFKGEARAVAALNHPHICQLYDIGPDYLVLEYVNGKPLKGPLHIDETVRLAIQIASALEEAHTRGILHRDLKPGNIMVTAAGAAKLLDFGLAKMYDPLLSGDTFSTLSVLMTEPGIAVGTPAYMSPEQAQGHHMDARSDIFSFGLVLYTMVSGRQAFLGDTQFAILTALVKEDPGALEAPPAFERIVMRCLAKQPADRFQTAAEVRSALQQISPKLEEEGPSIAVMPFANMSGDNEREYFSDGLAEEIINSLAQLPGLKVTARTSAFAFRGKEQDITKIAAELGVRTILEGSVRTAGNRIRVTAQLINAADGYHLWSQRYDGDLEDVFAVQDEIATAIAGALQVKLAVQPAVLRNYTPRLPAYEAYLKGRHHFAKFTPEALARSKEYFEQAIALDPLFAMPHCELALYYRSLALYGAMPAQVAMPEARAAARKALEIDPGLSEAHAILGAVAAEFDYDWKEATREFGLAMLHEPVSPMVHNLHSCSYLVGIGRAAEAVRHMESVLKHDPVNAYSCFRLAMCRFIAGQYEEAVSGFLQTLELDGNFLVASMWLGACYTSRGRFAEALAHAEKALQFVPWQLESTGWMAGLLARAGEGRRAQELVQRLMPGDAYGAPIGLYFFHIVSGNIDEAAYWIERAIAQRQPSVIQYLQCPVAQPLRKSPRWSALAKMVNMPESVP
jgi:serine/threonine protein kinase/Tfp pilus assembly protein PilF